MKKLSREQMKNVMGGVEVVIEPIGDDKKCANNSDCGSNVVVCGGNPYIVNEGRCINGGCRWGVVC